MEEVSALYKPEDSEDPVVHMLIPWFMDVHGPYARQELKVTSVSSARNSEDVYNFLTTLLNSRRMQEIKRLHPYNEAKKKMNKLVQDVLAKKH